jgi:hypothetical protein
LLRTWTSAFLLVANSLLIGLKTASPATLTQIMIDAGPPLSQPLPACIKEVLSACFIFYFLKETQRDYSASMLSFLGICAVSFSLPTLYCFLRCLLYCLCRFPCSQFLTSRLQGTRHNFPPRDSNILTIYSCIDNDLPYSLQEDTRGGCYNTGSK